MPTNSKEADLKPQARNSEHKYLTRSSCSSMVGDTTKRRLVADGGNGDSSVASQHRPCLQKNGKRVMKEKQKKARLAAAKTEKDKSPAPESQVAEDTPPPQVFDSMLASVSNNPALVRALAIIREDLKHMQNSNHKGPTPRRGWAKGGATTSLKRPPPKKEEDPKASLKRKGKEKMGETENQNPRNAAKTMKLHQPSMLEGGSMNTQRKNMARETKANSASAVPAMAASFHRRRQIP